MSVASGSAPAAMSGESAALPDPAIDAVAYRPFASDPGWSEAWWWLGIPVGLALFLIVVHALAPNFYLAWILPEGYGFLELGHFFIPLAGASIALRLLFRPFVRQRRLVFWSLALAALGCVYVAGEEHSWGQHFFYWDTPAYWAEVNRQQEINLHNVNEWFNHKPRAVLEAGIFLGGVLVPIAALFRPAVRRNRWALFLPADALVPVALGTLFFNMVGTLAKVAGVAPIVARPSEATESFIYLFLVFYLIVFARRIGELERINRIQ